MNELSISAIVCICVMGGALIGIYLNRVLPPEQIKDDTRQVVNVAIGLIATLAALVLGLMVASAKSSFDARSDDVREIAARIEMDQPFEGVLQVSDAPVRGALAQISR